LRVTDAEELLIGWVGDRAFLRPGEGGLRHSEKGRHGAPTSRSSQLLVSQQAIGNRKLPAALGVLKRRPSTERDTRSRLLDTFAMVRGSNASGIVPAILDRSSEFEWLTGAAEVSPERSTMSMRQRPQQNAGDAKTLHAARKVLIFDEDIEDLARHAEPFEAHGCEVHKCMSVETAMRCIEREEFDFA